MIELNKIYGFPYIFLWYNSFGDIMILGICGEPDILKVIMLLKTAMQIIRIAVPIILIVTMMITYAQASAKGDKVNQTNMFFVYRGIAAAVIFFIPTLVIALLNVVGANDNEFKDCMDFATPVGIAKAYSNKATKYLSNLRKTLSDDDYFNAQRAISNVEDDTERVGYESQLSYLKPYVDLMNEMDNLLNDYSYKKLKAIKEKIEAVSDEDIKIVLQERFDVIKESLFAFIGDYPIVPFGEDELYTGLKRLGGESLESLLQRNGSSVEELNEKIQMATEYYGVGTRKATVAAAMTLIGSVAEMGYQLPYFWGGKWAKIGINPKWGTGKLATSCNLHYFDTQAEVDACIERNPYWAMDCSGFVNWAVIQGKQEVIIQGETNDGTSIKLNSSTADHAVCDVGDALRCPGHIVLVVGLDDENNRYIIAEESSGLELDSVPYDGRKGEGYHCVKLDEYSD